MIASDPIAAARASADDVHGRAVPRGKTPLVLTANDESVGFAKAVGFKIVGKRRQPDGTFLTRLGWHAPRPTEPGVASGSSD